MDDRVLSLLGMCRRAGKLSCGHDAAVASIVKNTAKLCILCKDASQRLSGEICHAAEYGSKNIQVLITHYTMPDITRAIGTKAAVLTVDDEGFANRILQLYGAGGTAGAEFGNADVSGSGI